MNIIMVGLALVGLVLIFIVTSLIIRKINRGREKKVEQAALILLLEDEVKELNEYRLFVESIKYYSAGSPACKAQGELREHLDRIGHPLTDRHLKSKEVVNLSHGESVDLYLGKIADGLAGIYQGRWTEHDLSGECFLKKE